MGMLGEVGRFNWCWRRSIGIEGCQLVPQRLNCRIGGTERKTVNAQEICLLSAVAFVVANVIVWISVKIMSLNPPACWTAAALMRGAVMPSKAEGGAAVAKGVSAAVAALRRRVGNCIVLFGGWVREGIFGYE